MQRLSPFLRKAMIIQCNQSGNRRRSVFPTHPENVPHIQAATGTHGVSRSATRSALMSYLVPARGARHSHQLKTDMNSGDWGGGRLETCGTYMLETGFPEG